jgi:hypothetical protein
MKEFEKLEGLVLTLLEELRTSDRENRRLHDEVQDIRKKLENAQAVNESLRVKLERLPAVEASQRKTQSERAAMRKKVQGMLADLEQIDLI